MIDVVDAALPPWTSPWRVAVTRDEPEDGPLSLALRLHGFEPVPCPVLFEWPPEDPAVLRSAAARLESYDWVVCASVRAVSALAGARTTPWPRGVRTAAVGPRTAAALVAAGASPAPVVAPDAGAAALWRTLRDCDVWPGRHVLVPTVPGGRPDLIDGLTGIGAMVDTVDVYRMVPRAPEAVKRDWTRLAPDAVVFASPSAVESLLDAVGSDAVRSLRAIVVAGPTTAEAAASFGLSVSVADRAEFTEIARCLAGVRRQVDHP